MKVGDLVKNEYGMLGVIMYQFGAMDRWMVYYNESEQYHHSSSSLFLVKP